MNMFTTLTSIMDFDLNWYAEVDRDLNSYYHKLHEQYKEEGYMMLNTSAPEITGALVFEKENIRVAGLFYNSRKYKNALWINLAYVEKEYRRLGFYKTMHFYTEEIANKEYKNKIYSSIHLENKDMIETIGKAVGYEPLMLIVNKKVRTKN